jgi:hypothetical protein
MNSAFLVLDLIRGNAALEVKGEAIGVIGSRSPAIIIKNYLRLAFLGSIALPRDQNRLM